MKTKYGFVVLIDALGTKTDSIESSVRYLKAVGQIEADLKSAHKAALNTIDKKHSPNFKGFKIRFFGDTILLTYEIKKRTLEFEYFDDLSFVLRGFICKALQLGILFRGSVSLGEYLEDGNVVLGPAIFDAAAWYDKLEMIGIVATPRTSLSLKSIFLPQNGVGGLGSWCDGAFGIYPLKGSSQIELYAFNWPAYLDIQAEAEIPKESVETIFYQIMRAFPMPFGTETKFQNTEKFFHKLYKSEGWKEWASPSEVEKKEAA